MSSQRAHHGLIREYSLNHIGNPNVIEAMFLHSAMYLYQYLSTSSGMKVP